MRNHHSTSAFNQIPMSHNTCNIMDLVRQMFQNAHSPDLTVESNALRLDPFTWEVNE